MNYTPDQLRAIETDDRNLQIIACAGSGKTQVISERIVNTLRTRSDKGITPASIVAFTFTDKAAAELKDRIHRLCREQLGTDQGLGDMYIGTIHGFCLNVLQEPPIYRFLKYQVLSDIHQRLFIDRNSRRSGLTETPLLAGGSLRRWMDSKLYQQLLSIRSEAELEEDQIPAEVDAALGQYRQLADESCYLDYTTILTEALNALRTHDELRTKLADRLRYLIVDEYQDVNPLQEQIIRELFDLCGNICVVGDDDQTIYQWRGSDVNNIISFTDRYPDVDIVPLNINFRSSQAVVEAGRQIIERLPTRLPKAMESSDAQPTNRGDILALEFTNPDEEAEWIATKIQQLYGTQYRDKPDADTRGLTYSDMSVLLRSVRNDARPIVQALDGAGIPYIVGGMDGLFDTPEIQSIAAVFTYLADFAPHGGIPPTEAVTRDALTNSGFGLTHNQIVAGITFLDERKSRIGIDMDAELYLQRVYLDFLAAVGIREESIDADTTNPRTGEVVYYNLGKFSNVISDFEQINFHSNPADLYTQFASFLHYQASDYYPEGWEENGISRPDAVQIMTVHKAKGMQWPAVFVPCLRHNRFPSRRAGGRSVWHVIPDTAVANVDRYKGTEEDERRLFYVAVTRAEHYLFCTWAPIQTNRQQRSRSQFHRDLTDSEHVLTRELSEPLPLSEADIPRPRQEDVMLALTFSELKYYFKCPYLFKLRFLYGFDAPVSRALGYGKSIHDALAEIHAESMKGRIPSAGDVTRLVTDHLHLPFANAAVRNNLERAANEALTRYLTEHGRNLDKLEHVERVIELKLDEGVVVNGRIDLIRHTDTGEIVVVDFKSDERAQEENITQRQLHVYAVGYEQLTGKRADLIEIHNLDHGGAIREVVDEALTTETLETITQAGRNLRTNTLPRLTDCGNTCAKCDLKSICRNN
jgi:DNA helicase II / ATP-dependent DNA helicase PcrA